jgi:uncharacterized protein YjbI with pentapeptide repeats
LIGKPLSPERGQLLITLTRLPLDTHTNRKIYQSTIFKAADLRGANLRAVDLKAADLRAANLRGADLSEADLNEANLREANLIIANLSGADLSRADLSGAYLMGAYLIRAKLNRVNLRSAYLLGADLSEADLSEADLSVADSRENIWREVDLNSSHPNVTYLIGSDSLEYFMIASPINTKWSVSDGADLSAINLKMANLRNSKLSLKQVQIVKTLYSCKNLHDTLLIPLHQTHPYLFEEPK